MSIFSNILEKLGLRRPGAQPTPPVTTSTQAATKPANISPASQASSTSAGYTPPAPQKPAPVSGSVSPGEPVSTTVPQVLSKPPISIGAEPALPAVPAAIPVVDVMSKLEKLAAASPQQLDWKVSIVDLLKLLGLDSNYAARRELATELGCPADKMGDSAQMNTWLHKTVLQKIADNGGNIPKDLLG